MNYLKRIENLRHLLRKNNLPAFYIADSISLYYFTGLILSKGILVVSEQEAVLFVDGRYKEYAKNQSCCDLEDLTDDNIAKCLQAFSSIGLEGDAITFDEVCKLQKFLKDRPLLSLPLIKQLRMIKDEEEIACLKASAALLWDAFEFLLSVLEIGITEKQAAIHFEKYCLDHGAERLSFEPIIAFGENSCMPHYHSGDKRLKKDSIVLIDIGVIVDHYASDMTRTFFYGSKDPELEKIYKLVEEAKEAALQLCKAGSRIGDLDEAVRSIFKRENVESYYLHSLGHGIGLEVHEPPILKSQGPYADKVLEENMVVTIEPGLYQAKKGGVRIEEMIQITKEGYNTFFPTVKMQ